MSTPSTDVRALGWQPATGRRGGYDNCGPGWPLPNVWLGVSVEDQRAADERIPLLLRCPAAVRWVSAEPLLGPVDLTRVHGVPDNAPFSALSNRRCVEHASGYCLGDCAGRWPALDWVVVGGESGPGARPMHPDWARSLRDQCAAAGVPFLFKQWGEWAPNETHPHRTFVYRDGTTDLSDDRIADPANFGETEMAPVGKKRAGRLLDGVLHDAYPEARHA